MILSKRTKQRLPVLLAMLGCWLVVTGIVQPARQRIATLNRVIPEKQAALLHQSETAAEYQRLSHQLATLQEQITAQAVDTTPRQLLERILQHQDLAAKATITSGVPQQYPRYREIPLTVKLTTVTAAQMTRLVEQFNQIPTLRLTQLNLIPATSQLSAEIQLTALTNAK